MARKGYCPECGKPLGLIRFTVQTSGMCANRQCHHFKRKKIWNQNLCEFLDLVPYTKQQFLELPEDSPVWIEYYSINPPVTASDIFFGLIYDNANFAISEQLPIDTYGKDWRCWPTFKSFRPDQFDSELHPW